MCLKEIIMKVGILGSGDVAKALAKGFIKYGHEVLLGSRDNAKLTEFVQANKGVQQGSFSDAASFGDLVVLAVKGAHAEAALTLAGVDKLAGKVVIDATNPIADLPVVKGVLQFYTGPNDSQGERLQQAFPALRLVKAFNSVGSAFMVDPSFAGGKATMFIAGNDAQAKVLVSEVLVQFGWDVADMGDIEASRAIEPLCQLWCLPGFIRNDWSHAFALLK